MTTQEKMHSPRSGFIRLGITALVTTALTAGLAMAVPSENAAELLEKGIYTEQTVGDLDAAIALYSQVVANAAAKRPHLATAQFRLGSCLLKKGQEDEAKAAFEKLVELYPDQKKLVERAQEQLAVAQQTLEIGPAPWQDGEVLYYRMGLPTGKMIGILITTAEAAVSEGRDVWRLELRRFVPNHADNYGVSQMLVDRHTQLPIYSSIRHGVLGNADAAYGPGGAVFEADGQKVVQEADIQLFDNDQSIHLIRTLPLAQGYETKFALLPIWTQTIFNVSLKVDGVKTCSVPAGEFECYKVTTDVGQTSWYSTGPERYPVKIKGDGIIIELVDIGHETGEPKPFGLADFGFAGTLPEGWIPHEIRLPSRHDRSMIRLLDPKAATISAVEVDRCPRKGCPQLLEMAERELKGATRRIKGFELQEGSWQERTIDGRPALSFIGTFPREGADWIQYRLYTFVNDVRLEFIFRAPADKFPALQAELDALAESVRAR